jgi:hypothetical protein
VLSFSAKWIEPILSGKKDLTFRKWPKARVKVGGVYDAATIGFPLKVFAKVRVETLRKIRVREIDDTLAKRDGADSAKTVQGYWNKQGFGLDNQLWLIEFKVQK